MRDNALRDSIAKRNEGVGRVGRRAASYWSAEDIASLVRLAEAQATTRQIALELGRSQQAIRLKASRMGLPLTAHEVRRSARRHAKRQGSAAAAETKSVRARPRLTITVDFDLSSLTRHERRQLAERLRAMDVEEGGTASGETSAPPAARRPLRIHEAYDPSAATSARHSAANAARAANRAVLGWKRSSPLEDADLLAAQVQEALRLVRRRSRSVDEPKLVPLETAGAELATSADPIDRLELERLVEDPEVRARLEALENDADAKGAPPYRAPEEDEYARYRRYLRGRKG